MRPPDYGDDASEHFVALLAAVEGELHVVVNGGVERSQCGENGAQDIDTGRRR